VLEPTRLPVYPGALDAARRGVRTGGDARNRAAVGVHVRRDERVGEVFETLAFDPQTSGGLLAAVAPEAIDRLTSSFTVIGRVEAGVPGIRIA